MVSEYTRLSPLYALVISFCSGYVKTLGSGTVTVCVLGSAPDDTTGLELDGMRLGASLETVLRLTVLSGVLIGTILLTTVWLSGLSDWAL